jgi:hypothetical protein
MTNLKVSALIFIIWGLMVQSSKGQTISDEKCIKDLVFIATLDSIPLHSEFLPSYRDSLLCYPILFQENIGKIFVSKTGNKFKNYPFHDLKARKIDTYIEVLRFEITMDSACLELFNKRENMYVISLFKTSDCQILGGKTMIFEL